MTSTRGGAESEMRVLYDQHAGPLLGFALRITGGDRGRAEDIVQETLVRAWQKADIRAAEPTSLRPWLLTVARRIAIDQHRRRGARPSELGGAGAEATLMSTADTTDVEAALDRIVVIDALTALSPEHREVIVQTYYSGRTVAEAARLIGVPVGTVKSRTYYALKALKLALTERGVVL